MDNKLSSFFANLRTDKRRRRIFVWSALGVLLLLFLAIPGPRKIDVTDHPTPISSEPITAVQTINEDTKDYTIHAEYPALQGLADGKISDAVNADLKAGVQAEVGGFRESARGSGGSEKSTLTM